MRESSTSPLERAIRAHDDARTRYMHTMSIRGTFEVKMSGEPPYSEVEGVSLAKAALDKKFSGPLTATSSAHMLAARTPIAGSAGYVALERIEGTLEGKTGSFTVVHHGLMDRGQPNLTVSIVPDSGTGELQGIRGSMKIEITGGVHWYELDHDFAQP